MRKDAEVAGSSSTWLWEQTPAVYSMPACDGTYWWKALLARVWVGACTEQPQEAWEVA